MINCIQCNSEADIHASWLGINNKPQDVNICTQCMKTLVEKYKGSQFSQTLIIKPIQHEVKNER